MAEDYSGLYRLKSRYNRYAQENASTHAMSTVTALAANDEAEECPGCGHL